MILVPKWEGTGERWIYIAIGSWSGEGQFRFYANVHSNGDTLSEYASSQAIGVTTFPPTSGEKDLIRTQMKKITQAVYFATDGRHLIKNWLIDWDNRPGYPQCVDNIYQVFGAVFCWSKVHHTSDRCCFNGTGACGTGGKFIEFNTKNWCGCTVPCSCGMTDEEIQHWAGAGAVHEYGHCKYGIRDEYYPANNCVHSIMGGDIRNNLDFCNIINGGVEPWPGTTAHLNSENNWDCLRNRMPNYIPYPSDTTPDAFYRITEQSTGDQPFDTIVTIVEY